MYKIFTFGLIFSLVIQPVALSTPAFAAPIEDGDFSSFEAGDESELIEETEVLEEVVVEAEEEPPIEIEVLNEEIVVENISEDFNGQNDIVTADSEDALNEDILPEEQVYISKVYSKNGEEFIEIYNSGGDIYVENMLIQQIVSSSGKFNKIAYFEKGYFKSESSILIIQKGRKKSEDDYTYDSLYLSAADKIPQNNAIIEVILNGYRFGFCNLKWCCKSIILKVFTSETEIHPRERN